ncbi:hypothetical protein S40288_11530 [Stachybotrys chartarum IBT 40288]|nr:hypothetical protein S40288_11530 [Stachybotrys chartarum IBT 40288]
MLHIAYISQPTTVRPKPPGCTFAPARTSPELRPEAFRSRWGVGGTTLHGPSRTSPNFLLDDTMCFYHFSRVLCSRCYKDLREDYIDCEACGAKCGRWTHKTAKEPLWCWCAPCYELRQSQRAADTSDSESQSPSGGMKSALFRAEGRW